MFDVQVKVCSIYRSEVMALVTEVRTRHGGFTGISLRQLIKEAAECMTIKATNAKVSTTSTDSFFSFCPLSYPFVLTVSNHMNTCLCV